jgi:sterol desaturase/sphingolipid hydroxylase (fatty acid hydroxylase superfamily)
MKTEPDDDTRAPQTRIFRLIEGIASGVLVLVLAALVWMIVAAYRPEWGRLASLEFEVIFILALLLAALLAVSVVALLHTRR